MYVSNPLIAQYTIPMLLLSYDSDGCVLQWTWEVTYMNIWPKQPVCYFATQWSNIQILPFANMLSSHDTRKCIIVIGWVRSLNKHCGCNSHPTNLVCNNHIRVYRHVTWCNETLDVSTWSWASQVWPRWLWPCPMYWAMCFPRSEGNKRWTSASLLSQTRRQVVSHNEKQRSKFRPWRLIMMERRNSSCLINR